MVAIRLTQLKKLWKYTIPEKVRIDKTVKPSKIHIIMILKKYLLITALFLLFITVSAFAPDCWAELTLGVNDALLEYAEDMEWCDDNASILLIGSCRTEADMAFNQNIDGALNTYDKCCCNNQLVCCMP